MGYQYRHNHTMSYLSACLLGGILELDLRFFPQDPTNSFTTLEHQNPLQVIPGLLKIRRSPDLGALNLCKGRSGTTTKFTSNLKKRQALICLPNRIHHIFLLLLPMINSRAAD